MKVRSDAKMKNVTFWVLGSVRRAAKSSNTAKVLVYVEEMYTASMKVIFEKVKVRSQKVNTK